MNKKLFAAYVFLISVFLIPSTAYAYLDPGTGNALVYVFLSLLGAVFYFLKGVFYRFKTSNEVNKEKVFLDYTFSVKGKRIGQHISLL